MSPAGSTVAEALRAAKSQGLDRLDAQLLLAHVLARPRSWLLAHDDAALDAPQHDSWQALLARRLAGEPLAYLVGAKEFHGLQLQVDASVLVPRPETELLVDWAVERLAALPLARPRVVDLGTGSGAIGSRHFDLILSNPPYIAGGDPHLAALRHEPMLALTPGGDGLDALRAIVAGAPDRLAPGGWLLLEHGFDQADAVRALLRAHGLAAIETRRDLGGQARCTGGRR